MQEELKNSKNILYRPDLDYDKNYDTTGYVSDSEESIESVQEESLIESLNQNINNIKNVLPLLPEDIQDILKNPLFAVDKILGDIDEDPKREYKNESTVTYVPPEDDEDSEDGDGEYPETPFRDDPDPIVITVNKRDPVEVIKKEYEYDLVTIIGDYIEKLNSEVNKFIKAIVTLYKGMDAKDYQKILSEYKVSTERIELDNKHLSDLIIRSQITKGMKIRMYNKMFSIDKTIAHISMCKIGVQQRIRYYEESYRPQNSFDNVMSNRMLESSRALYDAKYKQNFINLYKYLNSSVIVLDECLNQCINEAQAKILLLKKEGNDLW